MKAGGSPGSTAAGPQTLPDYGIDAPGIRLGMLTAGLAGLAGLAVPPALSEHFKPAA